MNSNTLDPSTVIAVILAIVLALLVTMVRELRRKPRKPEYETVELLECSKCGYKVELLFEPGDFISMNKGKCPKCNTPLRITAIYNVEKKL